MCGIIGVMQRSSRPAPELDALLRALDEIDEVLAAAGPQPALERMIDAATRLEAVDAELRGARGATALLRGGLTASLEALGSRAFALDRRVATIEASADAGDVPWPAESELEVVNAAVIRLKDVVWAIAQERPATARGVAALIGDEEAEIASDAAVGAYWALATALAGLDRLEVRGRDSAGIHVLVSGHGLSDAEIAELTATRPPEVSFSAMAARRVGEHLSIVYKVAAEIGELGDNTAALGMQIASDGLLRRAVRAPGAQVSVLGHTRWASVGVITEPNAHPLNSEELGASAEAYAVGAVNGDIDNYEGLRDSDGLSIPVEITTDCKVVPAIVAREIDGGHDVDEAVRRTVARCDGSAAIAVQTASTPDRMHLALHGSGQSLYVGLADDAFIVASEVYGIVSETRRYIAMDGEGAGSGQLVVLDRDGAGTLEGISRIGYDGGVQALGEDDVRTAEITARDIDRTGFPHFLLKEISEAPRSFVKTLRGKVVAGEDGLLRARLSPDSLPERIAQRLAAGEIARIRVVAQGTAAVAGQGVAAAIEAALQTSPVAVEAGLATELSGFGLTDDMSDTLIVAVSQSGTTTDTNRTVDLVRARGADVIAIVNRRNSDLVAKSDGALYTSDGRDVEMSVASTKAFYAQVAAGQLLALALADHLGCADPARADRLLRGLNALPAAMDEVLATREAIATAARELAPFRRHWAVVGAGPNRVAAEEVRIKLSELCYHAIACDSTEDKKHIDLSSEPLLLICAAGLSGPNADDAAKEVAIFRAHKGAPIAVVNRGEEERFSVAMQVIAVPEVEPELAFLLSAMVGHLFGYEAARAIDAYAVPLRELRAAMDAVLETARGSSGDLLGPLRPALASTTSAFHEALRAGGLNGNMEASTAVRVASLMRYASGVLPTEAYELEYGRTGTPEAIFSDLAEALTQAISELTRPIDAIKHQAKTVTVGISRSEDELLRVPLVASALSAGATVRNLSYRALRALAELDVVVEAVEGYTRYRVDGGDTRQPTVEIIARGGVAEDLASRTDTDNRLLGTKRRAATMRDVFVAVGARDGRTLVIVPEIEAGVVTGLTLLHVAFRDVAAWSDVKRALNGYQNRYSALTDAVTETETTFDDELLGTIGVAELLTTPVNVLARRWSPVTS